MKNQNLIFGHTMQDKELLSRYKYFNKIIKELRLSCDIQ